MKLKNFLLTTELKPNLRPYACRIANSNEDRCRRQRISALGFYQDQKTAEEVLNKLKNAGFKRSICIHRGHYGKISSKGQGIASYFHRVDPDIINKFTKLIINDETLLIVQVDPESVPKSLSILRHVKTATQLHFYCRAPRRGAPGAPPPAVASGPLSSAAPQR